MAEYKNGDPDKGPRMIEGAHKFDKGYETQSSKYMGGQFPEKQERGNDYIKHSNEYLSKDAAKLARSKSPKVW